MLEHLKIILIYSTILENMNRLEKDFQNVWPSKARYLEKITKSTLIHLKIMLMSLKCRLIYKKLKNATLNHFLLTKIFLEKIASIMLILCITCA
jgi:hypothetical protein